MDTLKLNYHTLATFFAEFYFDNQKNKSLKEDDLNHPLWVENT